MRAINKGRRNTNYPNAPEEQPNTHRDVDSFFGLLTGTLHLENRISRLFHACFVYSHSFRKAILELLVQKKAINKKAFDKETDWDCIYQPQTPKTPRLKPDLLISRRNVYTPKTDTSSIFIESKIHAILTERQLRNYRVNGVRNLVALTKFLPNIPAKNIAKLHIYLLRWQDIHSALTNLAYKTQHDRFICKHFIRFLEEAEMAYDQALSLTDFTEIGALLRAFASPFSRGIGRLDYRFDCLSRCSSLLTEIALELANHYPKLKDARKWAGYYNISDDNGNIEFHVLQYSLYKKKYNSNRFCWSFSFPQDSGASIEWNIFYIKNGIPARAKDSNLDGIAKKGKIDPSTFMKGVISSAQKWRVSV